MVDVSQKAESERVAVARALLRCKRSTRDAITGGTLQKGEALATARIAGVLAAKQVGALIPLCHPLALTDVSIDLVPVADVVVVQAVGAYSELVLRDGSRRLHSKPLDRLLAVLPAAFERVHRSYLVRLDEVVRLQVREGSRYAAVLRSGEEIPVGRTRVDAVRSRLVLL